MHTIWLFYEKPGLWGLKVDGKFETADRVTLRAASMRARMRAGASPNAYLYGRGHLKRCQSTLRVSTVHGEERRHSHLVVISRTRS